MHILKTMELSEPQTIFLVLDFEPLWVHFYVISDITIVKDFSFIVQVTTEAVMLINAWNFSNVNSPNLI